MKYIVALLILVAGISAEKCSKEEAEACVKSVLASVLGDDSDEQTCREIESSINCLRDITEECPDREAISDGIETFEKILEENCKTEAVPAVPDEDTKACWTENEGYLYECIQEAATQALQYAKESGNDDIDEDSLTCSMYALTASCLIERVNEKCGEQAGMLVVEQIVDMPDDIAEACGRTEGIVAHAIQALEDKRKK